MLRKQRILLVWDILFFPFCSIRLVAKNLRKLSRNPFLRRRYFIALPVKKVFPCFGNLSSAKRLYWQWTNRKLTKEKKSLPLLKVGNKFLLEKLSGRCSPRFSPFQKGPLKEKEIIYRKTILWAANYNFAPKYLFCVWYIIFQVTQKDVVVPMMNCLFLLMKKGNKSLASYW